MTMPTAVMWDMDGTLTDTEPLWLEAELRLAQRYRAQWAHEDALAVVGTPLINTARRLHERGVALPPERIVRVMAQEVASRIDHAAAGGVAPWHRGAIELATEVAAAGIPQALVTSSPIEVAAAVARAAGVFAVVVSGDDVSQPKPDPAPYRQAAADLGVRPRDTVVLEDSPSGIAAGRAVGACVIAVETALPVRPQPGLRIVDSLTQLRLADLSLGS